MLSQITTYELKNIHIYIDTYIYIYIIASMSYCLHIYIFNWHPLDIETLFIS